MLSEFEPDACAPNINRITVEFKSSPLMNKSLHERILIESQWNLNPSINTKF